MAKKSKVWAKQPKLSPMSSRVLLRFLREEPEVWGTGEKGDSTGEGVIRERYSFYGPKLNIVSEE